MKIPSIFVVDDDAIIALRNCELLTKAGYDVPQMFASGEDLLEYLDLSGPPDLILMDIGLDGKIDGLETARRVRQRFDVPFIFLSSYTDDQRKARAQELSPNGYLVKPVVEQQLMKIVGEILGSAESFGKGR